VTSLSVLQAKHFAPPLSLFDSLLWRDFYFTIGSKNPTLHQVINNPLCLEIEWEDNAFAVEQWKKVYYFVAEIMYILFCG